MTPRYCYLVLLLLTPALSLAQRSLTVDIGAATDLGAYESDFGYDFREGEVLGPAPFVVVEGDGTTVADFPEHGCDPYTPENAAEVEGNVAVIARGSCAFVVKVQHAVAAGAIAALIYVSDPASTCGDTTCGEDGIVFMGGDCTACGEPPDGGCSIPAVSTSLSSGMAILEQIKLGEEGTITCEVCIDGSPPVGLLLSTGGMATTLFADGFIGNDFSFGNGVGFIYGGVGDECEEGGVNGLFVSTVLVGVDGQVVTNPYDGFSEFEEGYVARLEGPFPAPFESFEDGAEAQFEAVPIATDVTVTLRAYADRDEPNTGFIAFDMQLDNGSGGDLDDVYLGVFADFDAGTTTSLDDLGGFDETLKLAYVFDPAEAYPYFGVVALGERALSGWSLDVTDASDAELFAAMTTAGTEPTEPAERAATLGVGPFAVADGGVETFRFAFVAGQDEADLFANARAAQAVFEVAVEEATPEGPIRLDAVYPNPSVEQATVGFALPRAQAVRLAVYDVLGREVAVLAEGVRPAGVQAVTLDASGLGNGVYLVRLEAGAVHLTQRLTVIR